MSARIVIISGATGTGKTTISGRLAAGSACEQAVHIHSDDFYQYICKGYIAPWLDESDAQNGTVIEAVAASARRYAAGGYEVYVDGVIGPWFIEPWREIAREGFDVRYIVLRPDEQTTVVRATERPQRAGFPLNSGTVKNLWNAFSELGEYESHAINTTGHTVQESISLIQRELQADSPKAFVLNA